MNYLILFGLLASMSSFAQNVSQDYPVFKLNHAINAIPFEDNITYNANLEKRLTPEEIGKIKVIGKQKKKFGKSTFDVSVIQIEKNGKFGNQKYWISSKFLDEATTIEALQNARHGLEVVRNISSKSADECVEEDKKPYDPEVGKVITNVNLKHGKPKEVIPVNIPDVGTVLSTEQDPENPNILYATASVMGKQEMSFLRSTDGGLTWEKIYTIPGTSSGSLSVAKDGKILLLGNAPFAGTATIHFSEDGGKTFQTIEQNPAVIKHNKGRIQTIHLTEDGSTAYVADSIGQLKKYDVSNGTLVPSNDSFPALTDNALGSVQPNGIYSIKTFPDAPGMVFAGAGNHLYRLEPGKPQMKMSKGVYNDTTVYNVELLKNGNLRFSACNGIYESVNYNYTSSKPPLFRKRRSPSFVIEKNGRLASTPGFLRTKWVTSNPANENEVLASSTTGLYRSPDGGKTWKRLEIFPGESSSIKDEYQKISWIDKDTALVQIQPKDFSKPMKMVRVKLR